MRLFTGRFARFLPLTAATAAVALPAAAHTGVDGMAGGLMAGLAHPVFGLDHLLVMVAVGLWGAQLGSRLWLLPACFMAALSVGMGLAVLGVGLPAVEPGISGSVILLGLAVLAAARLPLVWAGAAVGLFAVFHGHAHGAELPEMASPLLFGVGMLASTAVLHAVGLVAGRQVLTGAALRLAGGLVALTGVALVIAG